MNPRAKHIAKVGAMTISPEEAGKIVRKSRTTGGRILQEIRELLAKPPKGYVTVKEFSNKVGIDIETCMLHIGEFKEEDNPEKPGKIKPAK